MKPTKHHPIGLARKSLAIGLVAMLTVTSVSGQTTDSDASRRLQEENAALRKRLAALEGQDQPAPAPAPAAAQPAVAPTTSMAAEPVDKDTLVLSPFLVTGDTDVGYQATSTLAGTRLRTELGDIGASITILNEELLQDTASSNLEDVLLLSPNTEVGGLGGNFTASQSSGNPIPEQQRDNQSGGITRIRGLAAADMTRDYFITNTPFDTFNTDRVEVQRGANAALFGLGSPGGIVNAGVIKADFLSNRGRIRAETDSYGSQRYSMRYNHVLNKYIALRVAALDESTEYEQKQAWAKDKRYFAAVTAKLPFNLTARGSFETAERSSARPDYMPPNDGITPWINMGKPIFNSPAEAGFIYRSTGAFAPGRPNSNFLGFPGSSAGYVHYYQDPANPVATFNGASLIRTQRNIPTPYGAPGLGEWAMLFAHNEITIIRQSGFRSNGTPVPTGTSGFYSAGFISTQITDRSIYDYRENLFSGGSSQQGSGWDIYTASLDGTWWDGRVGAEASYFQQGMETWGYNALQGSLERTIWIDPNRFMNATTDNTGTGPLVPNPGFGRPMMGGLSGGNNINDDREAKRVTGFVEFRAEDFLAKGWLTKLLGKLTVTGLIEENNTYNMQAYARDQFDVRTLAGVLSGGVINGTTGGINQADARANMVFALPVGGNVNFLTAKSLSDLAGANIGGVSFGAQRDRPPGGPFVGWDSVGKTFKTVTTPAYTLRDGQFPASFSSSEQLTEIDSQVFVAQHNLWDKSIVLLGTWRKDKQASGSVGAPQNYVGVPGVENVFDPVYLAGVQKPLKVDGEEETTSWSIMVHTPDFLQKYLPSGTNFSVYLSRASNFRPAPGRVDIYNRTIAPLTGATEESGFVVSLLGGKLQGRFNWYETGVLNNSFDGGQVSTTEGILLGLVRQLKSPLNVAQGFTEADVKKVMPVQGVLDVNGFIPNYAAATATTNRNSNDNDTRDFTSEGLEFELAYNPSQNWTMILNVAQQQTVTSNTYPAMLDYVNTFVLPNWVNSDFAKKYIINDIGNVTLAQQAKLSIVDGVQQAATDDGNPAKEERQWRGSFNTSYNFGKNNSMIPKYFGNLTVGGGLRYEDKMIMGFGVARNSLGNLAFDRSQPFYAPSETYADVFVRMEYPLADKRKLSVQFNVKDLTNHDDLIPFYANPDGSLFYRFQEGRLFVLSATLDF